MSQEPRARVFGEAIQKAMAEKGCEMTLEESQSFARTLIDLIAAGLIVAADRPQSVDSPTPAEPSI